MTTSYETDTLDANLKATLKTIEKRKQVYFSDKELEKYEQFLASKGKFSTYVKRLIEQDFNNSQNNFVDLSSLETKLDELKEFISEQFKESKQAPIVVQMQAPQATTSVTHEPKPVVQEQPVQEQKNEVKTEVNKAEVKAKAASFSKFRPK